MDTRKKFMAIFTLCTVLSALVFLSGLGVFAPMTTTEDTTAVDRPKQISMTEETFVPQPTLAMNEPHPLAGLEQFIQIVGGIAGMIAGILGVRAYELEIVHERKELMQSNGNTN